MTFRIAHISDLHVLNLEGVSPMRFLNKRITGYANLRFKRSHVHKQDTLRKVCEAVRALNPDHVVITGDATNLALESEFAAARSLLSDTLGLDAERVSFVPGNHDAYTTGAVRSQRARHTFGDWMKSDLALGASLPMGVFPFVKLRGPLALIGLSSAVAQAPLFARGEIGAPQRKALAEILAHPDVKGRGLVYLVHHPAFHMGKEHFSKGLQDEADLRALLQPGTLLHGHLHRRIAATLDTQGGSTVQSFGATSASLEHEDSARVAGFNVYEFDTKGALLRTYAKKADAAAAVLTIPSR
jgi:3',5'-cyclic AMP phosphodiesterase CpdA